MQDSLDKLLEGTGVKPAKKDERSVRVIFAQTDEIIEDLFKTFGEIFGDSEFIKNLKKDQDEKNQGLQ